jgi:hypothetical protein
MRRSERRKKARPAALVCGPARLLRDHIFARFKVHSFEHRTAIEATSVAAAMLRTCSNALMWRASIAIVPPQAQRTSQHSAPRMTN